MDKNVKTGKIMGSVAILAVSLIALLLVLWSYFHYSSFYQKQQQDYAAAELLLDDFKNPDKYKLANQKAGQLIEFYKNAMFEKLLAAGFVSFVDLPLEVGQLGKENPFQAPAAPEFLRP